MAPYPQTLHVKSSSERLRPWALQRQGWSAAQLRSLLELRVYLEVGLGP